MKILFITDNFPPEVNAPATRTYEHAQQWIKQGAEVLVVTCAPNFPHGKVYDGYKNKLFQREYVDGIEVIRVWTYISENTGFIKRVLDFFSFAVTSFIAGLFQRCDIIVATSPQFFTTWAAFGLSKLKRRPWVFELRDLWPESIKSVGAMNNGSLLRILEKVEIFLYKNSSKVIAVTEAFKSNLISRGIDCDKIEVITNGSNLELFHPREKDPQLLKELGLRNKFIVGYIGTHGLAHGLDFIINSIGMIDSNDFHFLFIGDGAVKKKIVKLAKELKLLNITFLEPIEKTEVPRYLSICDISLAPLKKDDTFKTVIPSKIFEASAMNVPTLLGVQGQAQVILEKYGAGLCYEPENSSDFIEKLYSLKDRVDKDEFASGCNMLANDFDRTKLANNMLDIMRKVAFNGKNR